MIAQSFWSLVWEQEPWLATCFANKESFAARASRQFKYTDFKIVVPEKFNTWARFQGKIWSNNHKRNV